MICFCIPLLSVLSTVGSVEVSTIEQGNFQAEVESVDPTRFVFRMQGSKKEVTAQDLISLRWPSRSREKKTPELIVELVQGDVLCGSLEASNGDRLKMKLGSGSSLECRIDWVRRILFPRQIASGDFSSFGTAEGKDRLYRRSGQSLDFVSGTFEGFESNQILFRSVLGLSKFGTEEQVAGLVLTPIEIPKQKKELEAVFELQDGSRITGKALKLENERLSVESEAVGSISLNLGELLSVRFKNGRYLFLSDLEPARVEESSPFGNEKIVLFPYKKDRSVGGRNLKVGGMEYFRGLGVHSRCSLSYKLEKKYKSFRTFIGIDDEVLDLPAKGSVVFRVFADGKKVYESPIVRGGTAALSVPSVDLTGVDELRLEVDYAEDLHVADRADWLDPILIQ